MADPIQLFSCTRLSARLTVKACGARFMRVRASTPGSYDSACVQCPVGAHHATHGTLCPDTTIQAPQTHQTKTETTTMAAPSELTDQQKRDAVKRVLVDGERREDVAKSVGVSANSVGNWIKRWGTDVASDAMDAAAAGGGGVPTKPTKPAPAPKQKPKRATYVPPASSTAKPTEPRGPDLVAILDRDALEQLGADLASAVCHIANEHARSTVAGAAYRLTQASRG